MYEPVKQETKEQYLKIWLYYSVAHLNQDQLADRFGCSQDTIGNAIKWAAENRIQFNTPVLVEAAKEALENRLRELKDDLAKIKESESVNWNAYIGIQKLIKENEELLWKLQAVLQDKSMVTINTAVQINQAIKARDEAIGRLTDAERKELAARIREIIDKREDDQATAG